MIRCRRRAQSQLFGVPHRRGAASSRCAIFRPRRDSAPCSGRPIRYPTGPSPRCRQPYSVSIGTPSISDNSGRVISGSVDFLPMIIFTFSFGCVGGPQVEASDGILPSATGQPLSSHAGRTGGWFTAEPVDNRCRCEPLQTPLGGQLLLAVTLCRKILRRRLAIAPRQIHHPHRRPT